MLAAESRNTRLLDALNGAGQGIAEASSEEDLWRAIFDALAVLDLRVTVLRLGQGGRLRIAHMSDSPTDLAKLAAVAGRGRERFDVDVAATEFHRRVVLSGETVFEQNVEAMVSAVLPDVSREQAAEIVDKIGGAGLIGAPLHGDFGPVGMLTVSGRGLVESDVVAIGAFARTASVALRKLQLGTQLAENATRLALAQARLAEAERVEAMGLIAAGLGHDINNVITTILSSVYLGRRRLKKLDVTCSELDTIERSCTLAADLTRRLMQFSARPPVQAEATDLAKLVAGLDPVVRGCVRDAVRVHIEAPDEVPVRADPLQIEQVVLNLAVNASDAMPEGGELKIVVARGEANGIAQARLMVEDTGVGMDPATRANVFRPFFSTKPVGRGTGLGLTLVQRIVDEQGGSLSIESELGKGTRVVIELPVDGADAPSRAPTQPVNRMVAPPASVLDVLIVEPDTNLCRVLETLFVGRGHRAQVASSVAHALEVATGRSEPWSLVLVGVERPDSSVATMLDELRLRWPELPVVVCGAKRGRSVAAAGPYVRWLDKPFTPASLFETIGALLGRDTWPA